MKIHSYEGYDSSAIKTYGKQIVNNIDNLTDFYRKDADDIVNQYRYILHCTNSERL